MTVVESALSALMHRRGKLLVLFGNEFGLMRRKIDFLRRSRADFVGSQLPATAARWLYVGLATQVLNAPAGLNPTLYRPGSSSRPIDIGFRGDRYRSELIGDQDRARLIEHFTRTGTEQGLVIDIEYRRIARDRWSAFLRSCHGTIGAESGTFFLERDDATQEAVADYMKAHADSSFDLIHERFWKNSTGVPGKAISSRHFEAIGTKTCQILVEGRYNDILKPGEHYIPVRRDLSDIAESSRQFRDHVERERIAESAYRHVMAAHTYAHRVEGLLEFVLD
jgi:spore maturation protein CgeB